MCGIFGVSFPRGSYTRPELRDVNQFEAVLRGLIQQNSERGNDQLTLTYVTYSGMRYTHIFAMEKDGRVIMTDPPIFVEDETHCILGHVRSPTVRTPITMEEFHPFEYDDVYMAHNGVLSPQTIKVLEEKYEEVGHTDSWYLLREMVNKGIHDIGHIDGTYAVWMLLEESELPGDPMGCYVFTNSNPIYYGNNGKVRYFTSAPFDGSARLKEGDVLNLLGNEIIDHINVKPMYFMDF